MFQINQRGPIYDPVAVQPMRDELIYVGFKEMLTPDEVHKNLDTEGNSTKLVFINSVCGCAAGSARPGVSQALQNKLIPDSMLTVFAGQDRDAVDEFREKYLPGIAPSSPFIALFRGNELIFVMQRYDIEGKSPEMVASELAEAFNQFCSKEGPSIPAESYANLLHIKACGSKIPLANQ
ncbi:MAG: BrxA/BrxB family bacilliredoxin [Ignavibacteria bacterium]